MNVKDKYSQTATSAMKKAVQTALTEADLRAVAYRLRQQDEEVERQREARFDAKYGPNLEALLTPYSYPSYPPPYELPPPFIPMKSVDEERVCTVLGRFRPNEFMEGAPTGTYDPNGCQCERCISSQGKAHILFTEFPKFVQAHGWRSPYGLDVRCPVDIPTPGSPVLGWHQDGQHINDIPNYIIMWTNRNPTLIRDIKSHVEIRGIQPFDVVLLNNYRGEHRSPAGIVPEMGRWFIRAWKVERI